MRAIYIAEDGKKFDNEYACLDYEAKERERNYKELFHDSPVKMLDNNGVDILDKIIECPSKADDLWILYIGTNVTYWVEKAISFFTTDPWDGWFPIDKLYDAQAYAALRNNTEIMLCYFDRDDEWYDVIQTKEEADEHIRWIRKVGE